MRDAEYDGFGPWVIEISASDPPSPLFRPYLTRDETPLISFKIPRKIERRDAHPGMNLYDFLVSLYGEELVILARVGDDVNAEVFNYRDIQFLRYGENLLKGNLHLATAERAYDLRFNAVSKDLMRRVVSLIRERYADEAVHLSVAGQPDLAADDLSFYFTNILADERVRASAFSLLAAQPDTPVGAHESSALHRLLFGAMGKTLLESLHLSDGRELKILSRSQPYKFRWQTVYGLELCYVPINQLVEAKLTPDPKNGSILNLNLETTDGAIFYPLIRHNPWIPSYARFLHAASGLSVVGS